MVRKSRQVVQAELNEIRRLLSLRNKDTDIAIALDMTLRQLYRLKVKIYEQDRIEWSNMAKQSLETKALKIMEVLDNCYHINESIAENPGAEPRDRIEASQVMVQAQINMFQLLKQGPTIRLQLPYKVAELPEKVEYPRANTV